MKKLLLCLLLSLVLPHAALAESTICSLPSGAPVLSTDYVEVSKNCAGSRKISVANLQTYFLSQFSTVAATGAYGDLTGKPTLGTMAAQNTTAYYSSSAVDMLLADKAGTAVTITGATSITGGGDLSANRTLSLVNDSATPGNSMLYGTDGSGVKGWYAQPAGGGGGGGSVTSVAATQPGAGLTITGSPITTSGTLAFTLVNDLAAIEGLTSTGFAQRTGTDTWSLSPTISYSSLSGAPTALSAFTNDSGFITGAGNAATATALQNSRTINGTAFDGTGNITVTAAAGTLTGGTLASGVLASSLTSTGILTGGSAGAGFTINFASASVSGQLGAAGGGSGVNNTGKTLAFGSGGTLVASAFLDTTNAANISSGALPAGRMPALTGDVASSAGAVATTIQANAVTNAKMATMANNTFKGNVSGSTAVPSDLTVSQVKTALTLVKGDVGLGNVANVDTSNAANISSGVLGAARGGAGSVNGILKADGSGTVSLAVAGTDYAPAALPVNAQTTSYTMVLGDATKVITMSSGSANTLTVPPNSSVAFPTGSQIAVYQIGAGQTTIAAGAGVTIGTSAATLKMRVQYSGATLLKIGTDTWLLIGDLAAS